MEKLKDQVDALFQDISSSAISPADRAQLVQYMEEHIYELSGSGSGSGSAAAAVDTHTAVGEVEIDPRDLFIASVVQDLRSRVGPTAMAPGEEKNLSFNGKGVFGDMSPKNTVHVDAFLYGDEDDVDELVDEGHLSRNYCLDCMSHNTAPLNFISHSASVVELKRLFDPCGALGSLNGKTLVDIGSRLGAVLVVGHAWSEAKELIGIEMNSFFCEIQRAVINTYGLGDRCSIVEGDVRSVGAEVLQRADVVLLHNVFDFFSETTEHKALWEFVKQHTRKGQRIVAKPALTVSCAGLDIGIDDWVVEVEGEVEGQHQDQECECDCECECVSDEEDEDKDWCMKVYEVL